MLLLKSMQLIILEVKLKVRKEIIKNHVEKVKTIPF